MLQRRGLIPYENLPVFDVQSILSRFVRRGTVDDPDIPNLFAREAHLCMFAERVCMIGENRVPEDEVRFLTKTFSI